MGHTVMDPKHAKWLNEYQGQFVDGLVDSFVANELLKIDQELPVHWPQPAPEPEQTEWDIF